MLTYKKLLYYYYFISVSLIAVLSLWSGMYFHFFPFPIPYQKNVPPRPLPLPLPLASRINSTQHITTAAKPQHFSSFLAHLQNSEYFPASHRSLRSHVSTNRIFNGALALLYKWFIVEE